MKKTLLVILLLGINYAIMQASIWRVNNVPGVAADFKTLQGAIDTAQAGDTLYVEGTQFDYGNIEIAKKLVIYGPGYFLDENDSTHINQLNATIGITNFNEGSDGLKCYGLYFTGRVQIYSDNSKFEGNNFDKDVWLRDINGCTYQKNYHTDRLRLYNSLNVVVKNNIINYISGKSDCSAIIYNNTVENEISVHNSDIRNNIIYRSCVGCGQGVDENTGNIIKYNLVCKDDKPDDPTNQIVEQETLFVGDPNNVSEDYSTDGRYKLASGSPATGAGENGIDCGAYGGSTPYKLSGLPPIPHIYEATIPASASGESGLPVTVKIKTKL